MTLPHESATVNDNARDQGLLFEAMTRDGRKFVVYEHREWISSLEDAVFAMSPASLGPAGEAVVLDEQLAAWAYKNTDNGRMSTGKFQELREWCGAALRQKVAGINYTDIASNSTCRPAEEVLSALYYKPESLSVSELAVLMRIAQLGADRDPKPRLFEAHDSARLVRGYIQELSHSGDLPENCIRVGGQIVNVDPDVPHSGDKRKATIRQFIEARRAAGADAYASEEEKKINIAEIDLEGERRGYKALSDNDLADVLIQSRELVRSGKAIHVVGRELEEIVRAAIDRGLSKERISNYLRFKLGVAVFEQASVAVPEVVSVSLVAPVEAPLSPESQVDREHVLYADDVQVVPDTHGRDPQEYGLSNSAKDVVGCGDIIDVKPYRVSNRAIALAAEKRAKMQLAEKGIMNPTDAQVRERAAMLENGLQQDHEREQKRARGEGMRENIRLWCDLLESGRGKMVWGNHELMAMSGYAGNDGDMYNWLQVDNGGVVTLRALLGEGLNIPTINYTEEYGFHPPVDHDLCEKIRAAMRNNPEMKRFMDLLFIKGNMYVIANEMLVVHAGIAVDEASGDLAVPVRNKQKAFPGLGTSDVGLDALDKIEVAIRRVPPDLEVLHALAAGSSRAMSPVWMRDPFYYVMRDPQKADRAMGQLREQARKRGTSCKGVITGHTPESKGARYGNYVLGADTGRGDIVHLRKCFSKVPNVVVQAAHGFGQTGSIGYPLSRVM